MRVSSLFKYLSGDAAPSGKVATADSGYQMTLVADTDIGLVPVGGIVGWLKSLTGTPALTSEFVECNGQTIADAASPYNGIAVPNLNSVQRFLRGASVSGGTGGADSHIHTIPTTTACGGTGGLFSYDTGSTNSTSSLPTYYEVVWVMRIK